MILPTINLSKSLMNFYGTKCHNNRCRYCPKKEIHIEWMLWFKILTSHHFGLCTYMFVHACHAWMCPQCRDLLYCLPHILEVNIMDNFIFYIYWEWCSCTGDDTTPALTAAHVLACCPNFSTNTIQLRKG